MVRAFRLKRNQPRVLILEPIGNLWGSEQSLLEFASTAADLRIAIYYPKESEFAVEVARLPTAAFPFFERDLHRRSKVRRIVACGRLLATALWFRPTVIHANQVGAVRYAQAVGRALGISVTTHVRFHEDVEYLSALGGKTHSISKIICISEYIQGLFKSTKTLSAKTVCLYNAYRPKANWRRRVPMDYPPTFACVGRFEKNKRQDLLLEAMSVLRRRGNLSRVIFYGRGRNGDSIDGQLKKMSERLGLKESTVWAGFHRNVVNLIGGCCAQVCPFECEGLGRVIFEAWDAGTIPIVWAGSGGPAELITKSGAGIVYAEQTAECLAKSLHEATLLSKNGRSALIRQGRRWLRANCDPENYAHSLASIWNGVK
ncbi:MAG TPA: glycosyltransferase family 4 protein [Chthoniobacterales bacterium]|jgi:glycosyltransferase involved in cell wall biosynthesis